MAWTAKHRDINMADAGLRHQSIPRDTLLCVGGSRVLVLVTETIERGLSLGVKN